MISKYVKVRFKTLLLNNSMKIVFIGQLFILFFSIIYFNFFGSPDYLFPFINGIILGNLLMTSSIYKLNEEHTKARFYLYIPQILFHILVLITIFFRLDIDPFLISTIALMMFLLIFNSRNILNQIKSKLDIKTFFELSYESSSYYSMAILGWLSGYGFSWIIKYFFNDQDVAQYIYIYTFSGIILLFTNSVFNIWNPYYLNSKKKLSNKLQNLVYDLVSIGITISVIIISIGLFTLKNDFDSQLLNLSILLSSFIFYVPVWRARLYFQKLKKGWILMRLTFITSLVSFLIFFFLQNFIGTISVYLFFLINAFLLSLFSVREFLGLNDYRIKFHNQFLFGFSSIVFIYLLKINLLFPLFFIAVLLIISLNKFYRIRSIW